MIIVYAIKSLNRKYMYVGMTDNIERRFSQHNLGREQTTAPYKPFVLIFQESFPDRRAARIKEKYLKSGSGKEFLKRL